MLTARESLREIYQEPPPRNGEDQGRAELLRLYALEAKLNVEQIRRCVGWSDSKVYLPRLRAISSRVLPSRADQRRSERLQNMIAPDRDLSLSTQITILNKYTSAQISRRRSAGITAAPQLAKTNFLESLSIENNQTSRSGLQPKSF